MRRLIFYTINSKGVSIYCAVRLKIEAHCSFGQEANGSTVEADSVNFSLSTNSRTFLGHTVGSGSAVACVSQIVDIVIKVQLCPCAHIQQLQAQILGGLAVIAVDNSGQVIADGVVLVNSLHSHTHKYAIEHQIDVFCHLRHCHFHGQIVQTVFIRCHIVDGIVICIATIGDGCGSAVFILVRHVAPQVQDQIFTQIKLLGDVILAIEHRSLCAHRNKSQNHTQRQKNC